MTAGSEMESAAGLPNVLTHLVIVVPPLLLQPTE